ncbi:MAG TPA: FAD-binding oxidoreductase [bacterium]|nr:FAD-binding oxidoreductase [bacterium]
MSAPQRVRTETLIGRLSAELDRGAVATDPATLRAHAVDGVVPQVVCSPRDSAQIAAVLRLCGEAGAAVAPWGGGTMIALGNVPRRLDVVIRTTALAALREHDAANLTATMEAGLTVAALQTQLAARGQFLPFDPPLPEQATVGGVVAAAANGPRRMFYGGVRDLVIGMKMVLADGAQIKAGGKVVKNVAGYDMCKLFTGSLGTLGVITEVTCKVMPLPEQAVTVAGRGPLVSVFGLVDALFASVLQPSAIAVLAPATAGATGLSAEASAVAVAVEGFVEAVQRHVRDISAMARERGLALELLSGSDHDRVWAVIRDFPQAAHSAVIRLTVPLGAVAAAVEELQRAGWADRFVAHAGAGTIWVAVEVTRAAGAFGTLGAIAASHRGHAVLTAAPPEAKGGLDIWGAAPPGLEIMAEIKRRFDPQQLLNPGRFVAFL